MNSKVLSLLGVLVAALAAILVVSVMNAPSTDVEVEDTTATVEQNSVAPSEEEVVTAGEREGVKTTVEVADKDIRTTVTVKE